MTTCGVCSRIIYPAEPIHMGCGMPGCPMSPAICIPCAAEDVIQQLGNRQDMRAPRCLAVGNPAHKRTNRCNNVLPLETVKRLLSSLGGPSEGPSEEKLILLIKEAAMRASFTGVPPGGLLVCGRSDCGFACNRGTQDACMNCGTMTCRVCCLSMVSGTTPHVCPESLRKTDTETFLALQASGFRCCDRCGTFVEMVNLCNRVTCRCGYTFCYKCASPEGICSCPVQVDLDINRRFQKEASMAIPRLKDMGVNISSKVSDDIAVLARIADDMTKAGDANLIISRTLDVVEMQTNAFVKRLVVPDIESQISKRDITAFVDVAKAAKKRTNAIYVIIDRYKDAKARCAELTKEAELARSTIEVLASQLVQARQDSERLKNENATLNANLDQSAIVQERDEALKTIAALKEEVNLKESQRVYVSSRYNAVFTQLQLLGAELEKEKSANKKRQTSDIVAPMCPKTSRK